MSAPTASCPGCGSALAFANAATLYVVCPHCGGASYRTDVKLEFVGKVAAVAPIASPLALGAVGAHRGLRFRAAGLRQLDHGAGPWNEWVLAFEDGTWAWLAEAQGEFWLTRKVPAPKGCSRAASAVGATVALGQVSFAITEAGEGRVTAAAGELPVREAPGTTFGYADLRGPGGAVGTLDFGDGDACVAAYAGQRVDLADLGLDARTVPRREAPVVAAERIACAKCGASLDLRDPEHTKRVGCSSCGALLDRSERGLQVLDTAAKHRQTPVLPLGGRGTLRGQKLEVLGMLVRSVTVDGIRYGWTEYLLRREPEGYRWLVCAKGHWSFVEPADPGDVKRAGPRASYRGVSFQHFQGGEARVDHVLGECSWEVCVGETVETGDYVAPPHMLSVETTRAEKRTEVVWSVGTWVPAAEVQAAFRIEKVPPAMGIAPHQPNPHAAGAWWKLCAALAAAVLLLLIGFQFRAARRPVCAVSGTTPAIGAAADAGVVFSHEFTLDPPTANLRFQIRLPRDNCWLGVDGAIVEVETGAVHEFSVAAEHYSGVTDGESWSEGNWGGDAYVGCVPAGRYALRLSGAAVPAAELPYRIEVARQVPSLWRPLLLFGVLLLPAVLVSIRRGIFEGARWAESDHADDGDDE